MAFSTSTTARWTILSGAGETFPASPDQAGRRSRGCPRPAPSSPSCRDPGRQRIQRLMRPAPRPEPVGETPEVRLIDGVEHLDDGPLDDLVLQRGDGDFILPLLQPSVGMFWTGAGSRWSGQVAGSAGMSMACGSDIAGRVQRPRGLVRRAAGLRCPDAAMRSRQAASVRSSQVMHSRFPGPRRASSCPAWIQS